MLKQTLVKTLIICTITILAIHQQAYAQITEFKLTASDASANDEFGWSVSISGNYAIVGAWNDDDGGGNAGSAYIFVRDGENWTEQEKLTASDAVAGDRFGYSVSISGDYAIIGAWGDFDGGSWSGSAYIFFRDGESWIEQAKLTASDAAAGDRFGLSVSISGDYAIVGTYGADNWRGSAYIFVRDGESWTQQEKLTASDAAVDDNFGFSVSISGDNAFVGAPDDDDGGSYSGSAYIFVRDGESWTEQEKLTASDAAADDWFGHSVSISGNYTIVGAYEDDDGGLWSGSAYIFIFDGQSWIEQAKLTASDAAEDDHFGVSVSINGEYAIVGAFVDDDWRGSAYIFVRDGESWTEQEKLTASDAAVDDRFGTSVSISGGSAIVGANYNDDGGNWSGSAYMYSGFTPIGILSVTPDLFDFGNVSVGETSTEQVTVKNTGTADLNVSSIAISGVDSLNFTVDTTTFILAPDDSLFLDVNFTPDDTNSFSASLDFESDGGTEGVALAGNGIELPTLWVVPLSIDFGYVLVGVTVSEQVTVTNTGTADLNVSSIAISGTDSSNFDVDTTPFTLAPDDSQTLDVSFSPAQVGSFSASLGIESDSGSASIGLVGNGVVSAPSIVSITDVPEDQGGWVFLSWLSSDYDALGEITQYGIWELNPYDEWVALGNVPAIQEDYYIYLAHTFGDSTADTIFWSTFMVTAHTTDPYVFFESAVDSGYSIDNLAPAVPTGLLASVTEENTVELSWDSPVDEDFNYFKIYRSLEPDFDPTGLEPFAETIDTIFIDSDVEMGETYYYILSAIDFNGNESEYTEAVEATVLSIDNVLVIPTEFALYQNYPNPFNPVTTIKYQLPQSGQVNLAVYNISGQLVETLVNEHKNAGYHSVVWNAHDVASGLYFYRISTGSSGEAGEYVETKKCLILK